MFAVRAKYWTTDDEGWEQEMRYPLFFVLADDPDKAYEQAVDIVGRECDVRVSSMAFMMDVCFADWSE